MKAFLCLSAVLAAASASGIGLVSHGAVHAPILPTPVSGSIAPVNYGANRPVNGYGHGQVSHQSVSKPYQGEHRSTTQSKAFGSHAAVVADAPNRLHGADAVVSHGIHAVHAPVHHAVHAAPVLAHAVHAPVHHAVHAAPIVAHAAPAYHAPVVAHAAPAYHAPVKAGYVADDLAEVSPYSYTYAVADDYSGAAFQQAENNDGTGVVDGEYSVNLPDGRIQHVKYHANDYDGYVADVTYEGTPTYGAAPVAHAAPAYHAPVVAHAAPVVAHAVHAAPVVAHAVHAPVAHAVHAAPVLAHGIAHGPAHVIG